MPCTIEGRLRQTQGRGPNRGPQEDQGRVETNSPSSEPFAYDTLFGGGGVMQVDPEASIPNIWAYVGPIGAGSRFRGLL